MFTSTVEKEWAEVWRKGRGKVEDWTWCVTFYQNDEKHDECCYKYEDIARMNSVLFNLGFFTWGNYGQVVIDEDVFEDVSPFELELEEMFEGEVDDSTLVFEVV